MSEPRCVVCAQSAEKLKCIKCKTPYCSISCQTVDWKERGHKKECKRLVKANAAAAAKRGAPWDEVPTPPPSLKPKAAPPVVDGPARGRADVERARAAAAATTATTELAPEPEHWMGTPRCPVCLEDWDVNEIASLALCCCKDVCTPCARKLVSGSLPCPLCRALFPDTKEKALAMLRRNGENGIPAAIRQLGLHHEKGNLGLVPSQEKATRLYQRAADLGDVDAMIILAHAYQEGQGVKLDVKMAAKYFRMAADRGHASAQHNLGNCFHNGNGVAQDYVEAFRFYKLAAEQGLIEAELNLGIAYANGDGVARDTDAAFLWLDRADASAAAKGHEPMQDEAV